MEKIQTLFMRDPDDRRYVTREVHPDCRWVIDGEGVATRKYDGTCVMLDDNGDWWARREVKPGKRTPADFVSISTDPATGKTVGWEPIGQSAFARWFEQALYIKRARLGPTPPGTYELVGPKVNGNPEGYDHHALIPHSLADRIHRAPRDYDGLCEWMAATQFEGIVWHHPDGRMAKLKRRDLPTP